MLCHRSQAILWRLPFLLVVLMSSSDRDNKLSVNAFYTQATVKQTRRVSREQHGELYMFGSWYGSDRSDDNGEDNFEDIEAAREKFEFLLGGASPSSSSSGGSNSPRAPTWEEFEAILSPPEEHSPSPQPHSPIDFRSSSSSSSSNIPAMNVELPPPPPLTTMERERRHAEIELLSKLVDGDDALSDLWSLWFGERGVEACQKLSRAHELTTMGTTQNWQEAEDLLRELIEEYGIYWVEPVNRLATICYLQRRFEEAELYCQVVLSIKPWHFGALSGIVMVYASQNNPEQAREWASCRLPTFASSNNNNNNNRRRIAWVQKAVQCAAQSLLQAEEDLHDSFFGQPDIHATLIPDHTTNINIKKKKKKNDNNKEHFSEDHDLEDAWQ